MGYWDHNKKDIFHHQIKDLCSRAAHYIVIASLLWYEYAQYEYRKNNDANNIYFPCGSFPSMYSTDNVLYIFLFDFCFVFFNQSCGSLSVRWLQYCSCLAHLTVIGPILYYYAVLFKPYLVFTVSRVKISNNTCHVVLR